MSDSSDEESINETSSSVQLGFIDCSIEEDSPTIEDTILGGAPIWLHPQSLPEEKLVTCDVCGNRMALYIQAFAPFKNLLYDRVIYVFGCKSRFCSFKAGSVKCIRGIRKDVEKMDQLYKEQEIELQKQEAARAEKEKNAKLINDLTKDLFGSGSSTNPFDGGFHKEIAKHKSNEQPKSKLPQKESYADVVSKTIIPAKQTKPTKVHSDEQFPKYPGYFVYVAKETFRTQPDPELEKYKDLIETNSIDEDITSKSIDVNPQITKISNMLQDKFFENFSETVQYNPQQILRYDVGGKPLLYSGKDAIGKAFNQSPFNIPNPGVNPSGSRQFEMQLMPKAIMDLEAEELDILNGMSWGTIIICTDTEDYIPEDYYDDNNVAYIQEYCGVQWEESATSGSR